MIKNKKILVLGLAKSGFAAAKLLYKDNEVIVTDCKSNDKEKIEELNKLNIPFIESETGEEILDASFDLIVKNPGIEPNQPCVEKARNLNIKIVNEMEIAFGYLPDNVTIIGITGSNGKTTTTTILYDLLKLCNFNVVLGGNIGYPLCEIVNEVHKTDILLLEISDHQLYDLDKFKTNISLLTNICPTHLDYYEGSYERYKNSKKKIFNHHTSKDLAIINNQNTDSLSLTENILSTKKYFNNNENYYNENGIYINNELIINLNDIKIKGTHNYENILGALLILNEFKPVSLCRDTIKDYLSTFNGVPHRIEVVDSNSDIEFYNDSKATNPTSTITALKTMNKPVRLILGGKERGQDFNELNGEISKVISIYAIGEVTDKIYEYSKKINVACHKCYTLEAAMENIKKDVQSGEIVLLSPASASWDQYDKFETRGDDFKKLVEKLFN